MTVTLVPRQVTDLGDMTEKMEYYLEEYNVVSSSPMALVMFRYALDHISRCTRVLLQDNGTPRIVPCTSLPLGHRECRSSCYNFVDGFYVS